MSFSALIDRVAFLNRYVTFRRTYETLDFDITYRNQAGSVPGPSEYDIRLAATVPAAELPVWVPAGASQTVPPDTAWVRSIPTTLDLTGVTEWHVDRHRVVGLDRGRRIILYRAWST